MVSVLVATDLCAHGYPDRSGQGPLITLNIGVFNVGTLFMVSLAYGRSWVS